MSDCLSRGEPGRVGSHGEATMGERDSFFDNDTPLPESLKTPNGNPDSTNPTTTNPNHSASLNTAKSNKEIEETKEEE